METATRYTPEAADVNQYLRATATYTDGQGAGKSAAAVTARVQAAPVVTLHLSDSSISEDGTESSTVTATLDTASSAVTTVTVMAPTSDVTLSGSTLTIDAGETASTGMVTVTAVNNDIDGPETKTVPVSGPTSNRLVRPPTPVDLEITDDDAEPSVTLVLSPQQISEKGQVSTVSATLSHPSNAATTVQVSAAPVTPAVAGDFMLSTTTTLTIAAGATLSSGTAVTVTSVDNTTDAPNKQVTVRGTATNTQEGIAGNPGNKTLLITDDEGPPTVTLTLSETQIDESGTDNSTTLTVTLSHTSSEETAVTVTAAPAAVSFSPNPLRIAAGDTEGTVTVTAEDNDIDGPEMKRVTISAAATNALVMSSLRVTNAANPTLTIVDDDDPPTVTLVLDPTSITENAGQSTVTASLDGKSSQQIVVTVATAPEYTLSTNRRLTFPAGATESQGTVTLTATDNDIDAADAQVEVEGTTSPSGLTVTAADLTITDDDTRGVTVSKSTLSIKEGDTDTYTVVLASEPTATVTIDVASDNTAVSVNKARLTFTTGTWDTAQTVTVEADDDEVTNVQEVTAEISHTVTDTASDSDYEGERVDSVDVTVTDDESPSTAITLSVNPAAVREGAGNRTVTVTGELNGEPARPHHGDPHGHGRHGAGRRLQPGIVRRSDDSSERGERDHDLHLTPVNDTIDEPDETVTVGGSTTAGWM